MIINFYIKNNCRTNTTERFTIFLDLCITKRMSNSSWLFNDSSSEFIKNFIGENSHHVLSEIGPEAHRYEMKAKRKEDKLQRSYSEVLYILQKVEDLGPLTGDNFCEYYSLLKDVCYISGCIFESSRSRKKLFRLWEIITSLLEPLKSISQKWDELEFSHEFEYFLEDPYSLGISCAKLEHYPYNVSHIAILLYFETEDSTTRKELAVIADLKGADTDLLS